MVTSGRCRNDFWRQPSDDHWRFYLAVSLTHARAERFNGDP
jgi:hypothetical protein